MPAQSRIAFMQPARSASGNVSRRIQRQNSANSFDHNARMLPDERGLEEGVYGERRDESDMQLPAGAFRTVEHHTEKVEGGSTSTKESGKEPLLPPSGEVPVETKKQKAKRRRRSRLYDRGRQRGTQEPGIDPGRVDMPDLLREVVIQVVDWSREDVEFSVLQNATLDAFLDKPRPRWSPCRWLNVNGLSFDVIKSLAIKYELHPLSIEDMLHHGSSSSRSKADYYRQHLFVSAIVHRTLSAAHAEDDIYKPPTPSPFPSTLPSHDEEAFIGSASSLAASAHYSPKSHESYAAQLGIAFGVPPSRPGNLRTLTHNTGGVYTPASVDRLNSFAEPEHQETHVAKHERLLADRLASRAELESLTKSAKVHIHIEQLSIFVLRGGTIISISQDAGFHGRISEVMDRIELPDSLIRDSEDVSFVLQALLDVVADHALDIVDAFREELTSLEARVLAKPDMSDVRHLHVLSAQLLLLKSTLSPFQQLLQGIRMQDDAKAAAAVKMTNELVGRRLGFVSHEAKVYLGDVMDHTASVLDSLDLFSSLAENLIGYCFNNLSYSSNNYMQALSVLSVIFLPLTFLSGYFGMNFERFPHVLDGSKSRTPPSSSNSELTILAGVAYFWQIAIPVVVSTVILFSWLYLLELFNSARRIVLRLVRRYVKAKKA